VYLFRFPCCALLRAAARCCALLRAAARCCALLRAGARSCALLRATPLHLAPPLFLGEGSTKKKINSSVEGWRLDKFASV